MSELIHVYRSVAPVGDVIFVHGLGGDPLTTWGFDTPAIGWKDWLSLNRPDLNIWSIGYRVNISDWTSGSMPLFDRAVNILAMLDNQNLFRSRPACFICHSLGGLLVKEILRQSRDVTKRYRYICDGTVAIAFLSTPHTGSDLANMAQGLGALFRASIAVDELVAQQSRLRDLNIWFRNNFDELHLKSIRVFFETNNFRGFRIVNETSSDPGVKDITPIGIDAHHLNIATPDSYGNIVVGQTIRMLDEAIPSELYRYDPDAFQSVATRKTSQSKPWARFLLILVLFAATLGAYLIYYSLSQTNANFTCIQVPNTDYSKSPPITTMERVCTPASAKQH